MYCNKSYVNIVSVSLFLKISYGTNCIPFPSFLLSKIFFKFYVHTKSLLLCLLLETPWTVAYQVPVYNFHIFTHVISCDPISPHSYTASSSVLLPGSHQFVLCICESFFVVIVTSLLHFLESTFICYHHCSFSVLFTLLSKMSSKCNRVSENGRM